MTQEAEQRELAGHQSEKALKSLIEDFDSLSKRLNRFDKQVKNCELNLYEAVQKSDRGTRRLDLYSKRLDKLEK